MRPRLIGRGNTGRVAEAVDDPTLHRFNEAPALQPGKSHGTWSTAACTAELQ